MVRSRKQKKLTALNIRMTDQMREELQAMADQENRSLSNVIMTILQAFLDARRGKR